MFKVPLKYRGLFLESFYFSTLSAFNSRSMLIPRMLLLALSSLSALFCLSAAVHDLSHSPSIQLALDKVTTTNPRERFDDPNKEFLQRSHTTTPGQMRAPLFRTKSLPSSKMRADEVRRAGLKHLAHKKDFGHQALGLYMKDFWAGKGGARDKIHGLKAVKMGLHQTEAQIQARRAAYRNRLAQMTPEERDAHNEESPPKMYDGVREALKLMEQKNKHLEDMKTHKEPAVEAHAHLKGLWQAGFGQMDFHDKYLKDAFHGRRIPTFTKEVSPHEPVPEPVGPLHVAIKRFREEDDDSPYTQSPLWTP